MFVKVMCDENRKVVTSASSTVVQNEATAWESMYNTYVALLC